MSSYAAMFGGVDANGLPHLASANSPLADYPGYLLNYEGPVRRRPHPDDLVN